MAEPIFTTILGAAIPTVVSLIVVFSTRERSSGRDHSLVSQTARDVEALKTTNVQIQATLATHSNIHEQTEKLVDGLTRRVSELEKEQYQARGREQSRRHQNL